MMFTPKTYASLKDLREAAIADAHSDTTSNLLDVFGYFAGTAYEAQYVYCAISETTWAIAGSTI